MLAGLSGADENWAKSGTGGPSVNNNEANAFGYVLATPDDLNSAIAVDYNDGADPGDGQFQADTFENQLIQNTPGDSAGDYPTLADFDDPRHRIEWYAMGWKGPYINRIQADAWGNGYAASVYSLHIVSDGTNAGGYLSPSFVVTGGPNRTIETPFDPEPGAFQFEGDDHGCILSSGGPM